jgi:hypothetical protein
MTSTLTEGNAVAACPVARRAAWFSLGTRGPLGAVRLVVVPVFVILLGLPILLVGQEVTAPSWVRERVEAVVADALGGGELEFEAITVRVPGHLHPEIRFRGLRLIDREGRVLARVPEATAQLSPRGLLFQRRLLVQRIVLPGAELSLGRAADGSVELAIGEGGGRAVGLGRADGLATLPDEFERLFDRPALEALERVSVQGLVVNYEDARAGRSWTVDGGTLELDRQGGVTRLVGDVSLLSGRAFVSHARLGYESPQGSRAARFSVTVTDVAASDVASQGPALAWLRVVDAPISLALRGEILESGALGPTSVALKMESGELRPAGSADPVGFDLARAYLAYDPVAQLVRFDRFDVQSDWGSVQGEGRAYLRDMEAGMPGALLGQVTVSELRLTPPDWPGAAVDLPDAAAQFRLRLDPFRVEVAQASLGLPGHAPSRMTVGGEIAATAEGWQVALDAGLSEVTRNQLLELWPEGWRPGLRDWINDYLPGVALRGLSGAYRLTPGRAGAVTLTSGFAGLTVQPMPSHPPITEGAGWLTWSDGRLTASLDRGLVQAAQGGAVDVAGTSITIGQGNALRAPATVDLRAEGPIVAALSLLDEPPWEFLRAAGLPVDVAEGRAEAAGRIDLFIGPMRPEELRYDIAARLSDVTSDLLVPGHRLEASSLALMATAAGLEIGGRMQVGSAPAEGVWRQDFAPSEGGRSVLEARVGLAPALLPEFGIALPEGSVSGEGEGELRVEFAPEEAPRFLFRSDLEGLGLSLPEIGWSKAAPGGGELLVEGSLGTPARIDRLSLTAPGLSAEGDLRLTSDGSFDRLRLSRLEVGDWLDAPVTLTARAGSDTPALAVEGGSLDLGAATFGEGGTGEGGPIAVALDRLQITDTIALTNFTGDLSTVAGLEGTFSGQVNGGPPVVGRVSPQAGRVAARVQSEDAGAVFRAADLFTRAEGGALDLLLLPVGPDSYTGELWVTDIKVREAPVLASLLNAASGVGLLQQLGGQGIAFDQVSAEFRIDPTAVTVARSSAIGAGLGLSLDGIYDTERTLMSFQGVVSPLYLVNGIGAILTRPGEGLLGVNFTLSGDPGDPQVGVNPLSVLTPGMFREIFRRDPPAIAE